MKLRPVIDTFSDLFISRRVASRFASADVSTPEKAAEALRAALASHFTGTYLKIEHDRGVTVEAGRMDAEAFAKLQWTEGYSTSGKNPLARVVIHPSFGTAKWEDLEVRSGNAKKTDAVLKEVGIQPFRGRSHATPEEAVKAVVAWFLKNQDKLKTGA